MTEREIFQPNNHSNWSIRWRDVPLQTHIQIADIIGYDYGLRIDGPIQQVDESERMSNNFRVPVKNYPKPYILLRKNLKIRTKNTIELINQTIRFLAGKNFPVPVIIPDLDGNDAIENNGYIYQAFEFVDGNHYRGTQRELGSIARNIAAVHELLTKIPNQIREEIKKKPFNLNPWSVEEWDQILIEANKGSGNESFDSLIMSHKEDILASIRKVRSMAVLISLGSKQVIRGDLHPLNTIFKNENLVCLLDFDDIQFAELARDLGNACHRFVRQYVVHQEQEWEKTLDEGVSIFIDQYSSCAGKLNSYDFSIGPIMAIDDLLKKLASFLRRFYIQKSNDGFNAIEVSKLLLLLAELPEIKKAIDKHLAQN